MLKNVLDGKSFVFCKACALIALCAQIISCSDDSSTTSVPNNVDRQVATMEDLLNCTENREGETVFVTQQNVSYVCVGGKWENIEYDKLTDTRDGQTYKTVKIGSQTWMAENLNFKTDSSICYNKEESNCNKYGRLYSWADAVGKPQSECGRDHDCHLPSGDIQGVCPSGWHLPSKTEWETLFRTVDGKGKVLKSMSGWNRSNGTDSFGFSALPAGKGALHGTCSEEGDTAFFWSSTENRSFDAYCVNLAATGILIYFSKNALFSIRCLKD